MSIVRFDPFRGFDFFNNQINELARNFKQDLTCEYGNFLAKMDIMEDDKSIEIAVEIPGVSKEDIQIIINDNNHLEIKGKKSASFEVSKEEANKKLLRVERSHGEFSRTVILPENIDRSTIEAKFNNGDLRLTIAKKVKETPNKVEIPIN